MELIFESPDLHIYDDFAHHPSAIQSTLEGLRKQVGNEQILAIIEPRSHTMKKGTHEARLASCAAFANQVIWLEPTSLDWNFSQAVSTPNTKTTTDVNQIQQWAMDFAGKPGRGHIVIMSNGSFEGLHRSLIRQLDQDT